MTEIFIDPIIIMTPAENASKDDVELYLQNLTRWLEEVLVAPHRWSYSPTAVIHLMENGRYPTPQILNRWTNVYDVDINTNQLSDWASQIFNDENNIELRLEQDYLVELNTSTISVEPEQFYTRWIQPITKELLILIAKLGACKHLGSSLARELFIATSALMNAKKLVTISTTIVSSEPDLTSDADCSCIQTFPLLYTPEDLPPPTEMVNLWDWDKQNEERKGVYYAINKYYQYYWHNSRSQSLTFSLCPSFFHTIEKNKIDAQELALKKFIVAMAAVLTWDTHMLHEKYNLRPLRVGKAANESQVTRDDDNAKAWRMTIIPEGAGWRLHFWKNGDSIEFANILKKHEPEIIYCLTP